MHALHDFLISDLDHQSQYAVIAYLLQNTLSDFGAVNRGVCIASEDGFLKSIEECKGIMRNDDAIIGLQDNPDRIFLKTLLFP